MATYSIIDGYTVIMAVQSSSIGYQYPVLFMQSATETAMLDFTVGTVNGIDSEVFANVLCKAEFQSVDAFCAQLSECGYKPDKCLEVIKEILTAIGPAEFEFTEI